VSITFVGAGTVTRGTGALTATAPAHNAGDVLILCTGEKVGSDTLATPGGWTKMTTTNNAAQAAAFALYDSTGSASIPSVNWSATQVAWVFVAAYRGVDPGLATAFAGQDRAVASTNNIGLPAVSRTPSVNGAVCFALGHKEKGPSSDGTNYSVPSTFSGTGTIANAVEDIPNGASVAVCLGHWIQDVAQLIASTGAFTGTIADSTSRTAQCFIFALQPAAAVIARTRSLLGVGT